MRRTHSRLFMPHANRRAPLPKQREGRSQSRHPRGWWPIDPTVRSWLSQSSRSRTRRRPHLGYGGTRGLQLSTLPGAPPPRHLPFSPHLLHLPLPLMLTASHCLSHRQSTRGPHRMMTRRSSLLVCLTAPAATIVRSLSQQTQMRCHSCHQPRSCLLPRPERRRPGKRQEATSLEKICPGLSADRAFGTNFVEMKGW